MSKQKKCKSYFQDLWLQNETFKTCQQKDLVILIKLGAKFVLWVVLHSITALFSHTDGTKHEERLPKDTPISFFKHTEPSSNVLTLLFKAKNSKHMDQQTACYKS